ncbi:MULTISPECIES: MCR_0457 family protein [Moraxella]|uniref:DUF7944 domain-containing protein n=2 Tax=Moraxella lacunata TaxID=477 RepID=A0A1B8PV82_MORLA|nr:MULTISPECIES: hypothetical protein [Moraxella]MBE9579157.1 hypothetical protein [Moraxella sp. K1664]MBE9588429.1 hypothetical protein [Moraxella sp. K1630]MBE9590863.1 hypothetical protein [Moraxella sp. K127]MBE9596589.1 hypothetical protein [Moraxella sp. K2450]MDH9219141.1 hypothetical protein [Moraxella lacunata]
MSVSLIRLAKPSIAITCHGLTCFDGFFTKSTAKMTSLRVFVIVFCACVMTAMTALPANAQHKNIKLLKPAKAYTVSTNDLTDVRVTKYELALVQVMAEMCPNMLHGRQRDRFYEAYDSQLRAFIPNADDPEEVLVYLSTQQDYRAVLQNVRSWTKSFPPNENRELCVDFANVSRAF